MVVKGMYLNKNTSKAKEERFYGYFDRIQRIIISEVKREKQQSENIAYRSLLVGKKFVDSLKLRLEEILPSDLDILISDEQVEA